MEKEKILFEFTDELPDIESITDAIANNSNTRTNEEIDAFLLEQAKKFKGYKECLDAACYPIISQQPASRMFAEEKKNDTCLELPEDSESINEDNKVKSALFGNPKNKIKTFAILSAENPDGKKASAQENNEKTAELKAVLKTLNLQYKKINGKFVNDEHSIIVFNLSLEDAKILATKYKQQSFFFGEVNQINADASSRPTTNSLITYYDKGNSENNYQPIESSRKINKVSDAVDFFSRFGDFKFNIDMNIFESCDDLAEIINEDSMNKSINDQYTAKSRALFRISAYKGIKK